LELHLFSALAASRSQPKQSVDCALRVLRLSLHFLGGE